MNGSPKATMMTFGTTNSFVAVSGLLHTKGAETLALLAMHVRITSFKCSLIGTGFPR